MRTRLLLKVYVGEVEQRVEQDEEEEKERTRVMWVREMKSSKATIIFNTEKQEKQKGRIHFKLY